ncbi:MAG: polymer-forming cytoskeletal protein [Gemmatimonadota bacterium]|nr:polymer-forming cytoskeletal protein [Gemmatimonadota bacterium]HEU4988217.1 polymer-forming cytoskeletal protein [Gemmatimonadaceae bacterium]
MPIFTKRPQDAPNPLPTGYSVFDAQMTIEGDVETEGTLRVDGRLRGDVRRADVVVIAAGAAVVGNVSAREVVIGGTVTGNVTAVQRVELQQSGAVSGDIEAAAIMIQEGGKVDGRMSIHPISSALRSGEGAAASATPLRRVYGGDAG